MFTGIVDSFAHNYSAELQTTMQNFIIGQARLQGVSNPSGGFSNGAGLGEPKFMVDLRQFTGEWGRPQRDGPPLRAIALIRYAKWLVKNNYKATALDVVWPVIRNDLAYTTQYWYVPLPLQSLFVTPINTCPGLRLASISGRRSRAVRSSPLLALTVVSFLALPLETYAVF